MNCTNLTVLTVYTPSDAHLHEPGSLEWCLYLSAALLCLILSGLASGTNIGLMSLSPLSLQVLVNTPDDEADKDPTLQDEAVKAGKVLPLIKRRHLVLVTLLVTTATADEILPICLDAILPTWAAIVLSVATMLLFTEVLPTVIFTDHRNSLRLAAALSPFVWAMIGVLGVITYPMSMAVHFFVEKSHEVKRRDSELDDDDDAFGAHHDDDAATPTTSKQNKITVTAVPSAEVFNVQRERQLGDAVPEGAAEDAAKRKQMRKNSQSFDSFLHALNFSKENNATSTAAKSSGLEDDYEDHTVAEMRQLLRLGKLKSLLKLLRREAGRKFETMCTLYHHNHRARTMTNNPLTLSSDALLGGANAQLSSPSPCGSSSGRSPNSDGVITPPPTLTRRRSRSQSLSSTADSHQLLLEVTQAMLLERTVELSSTRMIDVMVPLDECVLPRELDLDTENWSGRVLYWAMTRPCKPISWFLVRRNLVNVELDDSNRIVVSEDDGDKSVVVLDDDDHCSDWIAVDIEQLCRGDYEHGKGTLRDALQQYVLSIPSLGKVGLMRAAENDRVVDVESKLRFLDKAISGPLDNHVRPSIVLVEKEGEGGGANRKKIAGACDTIQSLREYAIPKDYWKDVNRATESSAVAGVAQWSTGRPHTQQSAAVLRVQDIDETIAVF